MNMSRTTKRTTLLVTTFLLVIATAASAAGPFQFNSLTPCRVFDSRFDGDGTTPLANGLHTVRMQGVCGIPVGAKAVTLNLTVVSPSSIGYIKLWANDATPEPLVSTLNFVAGEPGLANGAIVPIAPDNAGADDLKYRYSMQNVPGTGHIIFDVTGYFQ